MPSFFVISTLLCVLMKNIIWYTKFNLVEIINDKDLQVGLLKNKFRFPILLTGTISNPTTAFLEKSSKILFNDSNLAGLLYFRSILFSNFLRNLFWHRPKFGSRNGGQLTTLHRVYWTSVCYWKIWVVLGWYCWCMAWRFSSRIVSDRQFFLPRIVGILRSRGSGQCL